MEILDNEIKLTKKDSPYITNVVLAELQRSYSGLEVQNSSNSKFIGLDTSSLSPEQQQDILIDIKFKSINHSLPLENLCCRINNYDPRNDSQKEMISWANKLIDLPTDNSSAGLFLYGGVGLGKTHVSVGVAKELMKNGSDIHYINASSVKYASGIQDRLGPGQTWILDDLNSPYGQGMSLFKDVVLNAHNNGGRVFVTSNTKYETLIESGFVTDSTQKERFKDRIQNMFKILKIDGKSFRETKSWF